MGGNPFAAAIDQPAHRVVVLDAVCRLVTVLDTRDGHLVARFALPQKALPTAAAADPARHQFLVGAVTLVHAAVPGPPSARSKLLFVDDRTLHLIRSVPVSTHLKQGTAPTTVAVDPLNAHVMVVRADGTVVTISAVTGRVLHWGWSSANVRQAAIDPSVHHLFTADGGGLMGLTEGTSRPIGVVDTTSGRLLRHVALTPPTPASSPPVPPLGESATIIGVEKGRGAVLVTSQDSTGRSYLVELDSGTGEVVRRVRLPGTQGPTQIVAALDLQLGRVYIALPEGSKPIRTNLLMLSIADFSTIRSVTFNVPFNAMGVDIHAHRIFAVDGQANVAHVLDTWSGRAIRSIRLAPPSTGTNAASILISGRTHRAFIGEGNGVFSVLNSSLPRLGGTK